MPATIGKRASGRAGLDSRIKQHGFRILAHRAGDRVRLLTRGDNNFANRFPLVVAAIAALTVRSCVIDGEAIVCDDEGLAVFDLIRGHGSKSGAILCAFDLLELDGQDLRKQAIDERKRVLAELLSGPHPGIAFNENYDGDGAVIYKHACAPRLRGHRVKTARVAIPYRPLSSLAEDQEPTRRRL